jgi:unsaturated rhamnogalacturonyl hydrolase
MMDTPTPEDIGRLLAQRYGYELASPPTYPLGVSLASRLRLATRDDAKTLAEETALIARMVSPIVDDPSTIPDAAPCLSTGCFALDLARSTGDEQYVGFARNLADRFTADPDIRVEDFYFAGTLLGQAHVLTGETGYADALHRLLLSADTQQPNGLYWHCHGSPWFWGRGNAFAALGVAETLTHVMDHPQREQLLDRHLKHLTAMAALQHESGMWHQVMDDSSTYLEHSATTMTGCAIARGIRLGWLPRDTWKPVVERAWTGSATRVGADGELDQVCVGTGPLPTLKDYVKRPFSTGRDDRGGAMALQFAVEMLRLGDVTA